MYCTSRIKRASLSYYKVGWIRVFRWTVNTINWMVATAPPTGWRRSWLLLMKIGVPTAKR